MMVFTGLVYKIKGLQIQGLKPRFTALLYLVKCCAGLLVWYVYTFHYTDVRNNDAHKFFSDALVLQQIRAENSTAFAHLMLGTSTPRENDLYAVRMLNWERNFDEAPVNENRTVIRLNALLLFFTGKSYFAHIAIMCFLSLIGFIWMVNSLFRRASPQQIILAFLCLLFPSILFWTSGVMKEPVLIFGLGLFMYGLTLTPTKGIKGSLLLFAGMLVLLSIKFYVLLCLLPAAFAFLLFHHNQQAGFNLLKYSAIYLLLLVFAFSLQHFSRFNLPQMLANKQEHAIKEASYFNAGSRIEIPRINADALSILKTVPAAIVNAITRPWPTEGKNALMLLTALENLGVLLLLFYCGWTSLGRQYEATNQWLFLLTAAFSYFALIGICTPVLGNLVRYKAPLLPLLLFAFVLRAKLPALPEKITRYIYA